MNRLLFLEVDSCLWYAATNVSVDKVGFCNLEVLKPLFVEVRLIVVVVVFVMVLIVVGEFTVVVVKEFDVDVSFDVNVVVNKRGKVVEVAISGFKIVVAELDIVVVVISGFVLAVEVGIVVIVGLLLLVDIGLEVVLTVGIYVTKLV